jgi:hypothetical protein
MESDKIILSRKVSTLKVLNKPNQRIDIYLTQKNDLITLFRMQCLRSRPCLHMQCVRFRPCLQVQCVRFKPCLQVQCVRFRHCLHMQCVRSRPCLHMQCIKNSCSQVRISISRSEYEDIRILENHKKGNFTSSYSQIWKCSKSCSFEKPVVHVTKEIYLRNISVLYHLYSIVFFTYSVTPYNRCIRIYLSVKMYFMNKHDFKELCKKMMDNRISHRNTQNRQLYTYNFSSLDIQKDKNKKETFCNNNSFSSISSDQHCIIKEEICPNIKSSFPVPSGPGGGPANVFSRDQLEQYMMNPNEFTNIPYFIFNGHMTASAVEQKLKIIQVYYSVKYLLISLYLTV